MKSALMVLLHSDPFAADAGGTEMHVLDRIASLALPRAVIVYPFMPDCVNAALILDGRVAAASFYSFPLKVPLLRFAHTHQEVEELLEWLARVFGVSALSVEHALYFPLNALKRFQDAGLGVVTVHHDFYCVCPSLNLLDISTYTVCKAHAGHPEMSPRCLENYFKSAGATPPCPAETMLVAHQQLWGEILNRAERIMFPSESARTTVLATYPRVADRTAVVPHGYASIQAPATKSTGISGTLLRVALIGQVAHRIKGRELILELLSATRALPLEWHFFGDVEYLNFTSRVDELGVRRVYHGPYQRADIIDKLRSSGVDVSLFTSVCPETFSFTLSEALLAGVPPIVPRLGALADRVTSAGAGWIIDPNSASAVEAILKELCVDRSKVAAEHQRLAAYKHTTLPENAAAYATIYAPLLQKESLAAPDESALRMAADTYTKRKVLREQQLLAAQPAYKRSIFYGAYKSLKYLVPVSVRNGLYRLLVSPSSQDDKH
jgi:glycosyltransferase involved in cell wall biosynthesis